MAIGCVCVPLVFFIIKNVQKLNRISDQLPTCISWISFSRAFKRTYPHWKQIAETPSSVHFYFYYVWVEFVFIWKKKRKKVNFEKKSMLYVVCCIQHTAYNMQEISRNKGDRQLGFWRHHSLKDSKHKRALEICHSFFFNTKSITFIAVIRSPRTLLRLGVSWCVDFQTKSNRIQS